MRVLHGQQRVTAAVRSGQGRHHLGGLSELIDIGAGLPTVGNTHDVVRKVDPAARVLYVDNDPMVLLHSRALIDSGMSSVSAPSNGCLAPP